MTILKAQGQSIWDYAENEVKKPDALTQIQHSSSYRALKKIISTKAGAASGASDVAQTAAGFIPLPVVGTIVANLIGSIHSAVRQARIKI